jgi:hypothetical protein
MGPEADMAGQAGLVGWGVAQHDRLPVTGEGRPGTELRRERPRGKGSRRTRSSPGGTGEVSLARYGPAASNLATASSGTCGGNGDGVGYSGHLRPIASMGR